MRKISYILLILLLAGTVFADTPLVPVGTVNQDMEMKKAKWLHTVKGSYKTYYPELAERKIVGTKWAGIEIITPIKSTKISDTLFMNNRGEQAMRKLLDRFCGNYTLINYKLIDQFGIQVSVSGGRQIIYAEGNLLCIR